MNGLKAADIGAFICCCPINRCYPQRILHIEIKFAHINAMSIPCDRRNMSAFE